MPAPWQQAVGLASLPSPPAPLPGRGAREAPLRLSLCASRGCFWELTYLSLGVRAVLGLREGKMMETTQGAGAKPDTWGKASRCYRYCVILDDRPPWP